MEKGSLTGYGMHILKQIPSEGLLSGYGSKNNRVFAGVMVICALLFTYPSYLPAQQDPPLPQCCSRVFAAGLELGWAEAVASYSDVVDNEIIGHLNQACQHIEGAHRACSAINPAWSGFRYMTGELQGLATRLQNNPSRKTRTEISKRLIVLYKGYADSLRNQIVAGEKVHKDTCGANYFLLGHHLAWAHYTFQVASDPGLPEKSATDFRTFGLRRIKWAISILNQLAQVRPVTGGCVELWRDGFIKEILKRMLNDRNLNNNQLVSMANRCWQDTLRAMTEGIPELRINSCARATRSGTRQPTNASPPNTATQGGGGSVSDYTNSSTHFSCKAKQNQEGKCCCFTGSHTYRFKKGRVQKVIARVDTGKKHNCRSTVKFDVHTDGKWITVGTFDAVSSRGGNTNAPTDVSVPVNRIIDGFRLGDGCRCCIDNSEIWLR